MFVVAGLTGNTGAAVAATLLEHGQAVRGLVRDRSRAAVWASREVELVETDVNDPARLAEALRGADGAYLLVPPDLAEPDPVSAYRRTAESIRDAVIRAGLRRLVFLSSEAADKPFGTGPIVGLHEAETVLADVTPRTTFLRASFFQENWRSVFDLARAQGILPTMLADPVKKRPMVATADIGRVAAELLLEADPPAIVELGGPVAVSARDVAAAMGAIIGRDVTVVQPPREQWVGILTGAGVGKAYSTLIAEMYDGINSGHVAFVGQGQSMAGGSGCGRRSPPGPSAWPTTCTDGRRLTKIPDRLRTPGVLQGSATLGPRSRRKGLALRRARPPAGPACVRGAGQQDGPHRLGVLARGEACLASGVAKAAAA